MWVNSSILLDDSGGAVAADVVRLRMLSENGRRREESRLVTDLGVDPSACCRVGRSTAEGGGDAGARTTVVSRTVSAVS